MNYAEQIKQMRDELRTLNKAIPEVSKSFAHLSLAVKDEGVIELKHKEFVAVAIAVAIQCQPCVNFHVDALMKAGGTREELADILAMCIQMGGGPALMYAGHALACWDELAAQPK